MDFGPRRASQLLPFTFRPTTMVIGDYKKSKTTKTGGGGATTEPKSKQRASGWRHRAKLFVFIVRAQKRKHFRRSGPLRQGEKFSSGLLPATEPPSHSRLKTNFFPLLPTAIPMLVPQTIKITTGKKWNEMKFKQLLAPHVRGGWKMFMKYISSESRRRSFAKGSPE